MPVIPTSIDNLSLDIKCICSITWISCYIRIITTLTDRSIVAISEGESRGWAGQYTSSVYCIVYACPARVICSISIVSMWTY